MEENSFQVDNDLDVDNDLVLDIATNNIENQISGNEINNVIIYSDSEQCELMENGNIFEEIISEKEDQSASSPIKEQPDEEVHDLLDSKKQEDMSAQIISPLLTNEEIHNEAIEADFNTVSSLENRNSEEIKNSTSLSYTEVIKDNMHLESSNSINTDDNNESSQPNNILHTNNSQINFNKTFNNNVSDQSDISNILNKIITQSELSIHEKYKEVKGLLSENKLHQKQAIDILFYLLVNGTFDVEQTFVIESSQRLACFLDVCNTCSLEYQTEIWSVFTAILKKSKRNLICCTEVGMISFIINKLRTSEGVLCDFLVEILGILSSFSITVKELKLIFEELKPSDEASWSSYAVKLLIVLRQMLIRQGPDEFFSFPGKTGSAISIPPIARWPYQNGWTFHCWFYLDPVTGCSIERERPYLYSFKTSKGVGYTAHFLGSALVVTAMKLKGKGFQHCLRYEFLPRKWYMVSLVHVYNRWSKSEIRCYVDGVIVSHTEMSWLVVPASGEIFDRCFLGAPDTMQEPDSMLSGQLASAYCFSEALTPQQINALYALGAGYKGQFRFEAESSARSLNASQRRVLYEGRLHQCIMFLYHPAACDGQLCLDQTPRLSADTSTPSNVFQHSAHALMTGEVRPMASHGLHSALHSLGGVHLFYPLFGQLDLGSHAQEQQFYWTPTLIRLIGDLLRTSTAVQQQFLQTKGFLVISNYLERAKRPHRLNREVLEAFLEISRYLIGSCVNGVTLGACGALLKQIFDHVLFNPALWINAAPVPVQCHLYKYLATEFVQQAPIFNAVRRVSAVLQTAHTLKYYYWIVNPRARSGYLPKGVEDPSQRPGLEQITTIRASLLIYMKQLVLRGSGIQDDELQAILNYLVTVQEDDNLRDVLYFCMNLMSEHPASMVPAFDRKCGIRAVFKLLASEDEKIRIHSLKLMGFFLTRSTHKRKSDAMSPQNLFSLIGERLLLYSSSLSMATYNTLFEILTEKMTLTVTSSVHEAPDQNHRLENPLLLKVIAHIIRASKPAAGSAAEAELSAVKSIFLRDLVTLCEFGRENRRTILQMSVWQDWLFVMAPIFASNADEQHLVDQVMKLFRMLLHHAVRYEYGGWRVWIDTLAILHAKVSFELHRRAVESPEGKNFTDDCYSDSASATKDIDDTNVDLGEGERAAKMILDRVLRRATADPAARHQLFSPGPRAAPFRIPEFSWSFLHQRLLNDLLEAVEADLNIWKCDTNGKSVLDHVNASENHVYVVNLIHLVSQLSDTLVTSCGGLLPLLAAATSPNGEVDMLEPSQGLKIEEAVAFLLRLMSLADLVVFASSQSFSELEQEKNMAAGGILRQCLRLVCTSAVRNCLECRYQQLMQIRDLNLTTASSESSNHFFFREDCIFPSPPILALIQGLQSSCEALAPTTNTDQRQISNVERQRPVKDAEQLLQEMDINRLRAVVYRDVEETKQAQFLSLAIVYFVSVLMVSKYRDILEPNTLAITPSSSAGSQRDMSSAASGTLQTLTEDSESKRFPLTTNANQFEHGKVNRDKLKDQGEESTPEFENSLDNENEEDIKDYEDENKDDDIEDEKPEADRRPIAAISDPPNFRRVLAEHPVTLAVGGAGASDLPGTVSVQSNAVASHDNSLTARLERALGSAAPLLREIFIDFAPFLSKTLIGSHGQELLVGSLVTLKQSNSVVELVMLLCSQEWQNSLQKHAGLAFIELVNEGRLLSHATRDHIVRVANEAEFILNRMRADDVQKHAEFEQLSAQTSAERKDEERLCDHLITSARQRDAAAASHLKHKVMNIMLNYHGPWGFLSKMEKEFFRLDIWEDDSRRRRRLVRNPHGTSHPEATLRAAVEHGATPETVEMAREAVRLFKLGNGGTNRAELQGHGVTDEELLNTNESESEITFAGPVALSTKCTLLAPGVQVVGTLSITKQEMYFEIESEAEENQHISDQVYRYVDHLHSKWHFSEIRAIFSRRYLHKNVSLEIFMANRSAVMFALPDQITVKKVVDCLPRVGIGVKYGLPQTRKSSLAAPHQIFKLSNMTQKWQRREISNFDYLMYLNTVAGRSFNDLNQYPVYPWVISNYESTELDLSAPNNYRDLSKPVGALNPARRTFFEQRFVAWEEEAGAQDQPAFHYGTHYSTSAFVLNYLLRLEPFTSLFLALQGGKFDHANRTFHSVAQTWKNCQRDTSDVKELIPEFFFLPEMFENGNGYQLGTTDDGLHINDVVLPPWASTPEDFVRIQRQALESEFVSCQLHQWIDLIFGYKQRGPEARRATNVFVHLTYEGCVDWSRIHDSVQRRALEDQIRCFGQTPSQLLTEPHPPRNSALHCSPMMFSQIREDVCMIMKFLSNSPVVLIAANTHPAVPQPAVTTVSANRAFAVNRWNNQAAAAQQQPNPPQYGGTSGGGSNGPALGNTSASDSSNRRQSVDHAAPLLPLAMDPIILQQPLSSRRHLGDTFDERMRARCTQFCTTPDNKIMFVSGFWDKSFRVYTLEQGRIIQVVYGHYGVVTCLARSECNFSQDCYLVTGSSDCTVLLWLWSNKQQSILGDSQESPTPKATLTGHHDELVCLAVSAELGLIVSGSQQGVVLMHTTHGDLLRCLEPPGTSPAQRLAPELIALNREGLVVVQFGVDTLVCYTFNGKLVRHCRISDSGRIHALLLSRCGQYVVTGGDSGVAEVRRSHDLRQLYAFPTCDAAIRSLALTHDQRFLLAGLASGCLVVFNIDFNRWHHEFQERYS